MRRRRRFGIAALCAVALALGLGSSSAQGKDAFDPLLEFYASVAREGKGPAYPLGGVGFEGPCGLAVDVKGNFYVSDYYHAAVDVFTPFPKYLTQLFGDAAAADPCGLAVDAGGGLYVNNYHRDVVRFLPSAFPPASTTTYGAATVIDSAHPTGVAVDRSTGRIYVDDRTYVAVYEPSGAPVLDEGVPLRIGLGSLGDGYGVAVSEASGLVYVPDAEDDTVKIYDPGGDTENPVELDGHETPEEQFVSLRDSAVAIDQASGLVYVVDDLQPAFDERPEAAVYAFEADRTYAGRLKYNIVDARPAGLAVGGGRVYVTSGNSEDAVVYAYTAGALTPSVFPAPGGGVSTASPLAPEQAVPSPASAGAAAASTELASPPALFRPAGRSRRPHARHRHRSGHARRHAHRRHR